MNPFLITKPLRFLVLMIIVSLPCGILFTVSNLLNEEPWLICIPVALGSVLVVAGEFWENITYGWGESVTKEEGIKSFLTR
ncbi:MAG: hypothetical protein WC685_01555 [Methylobacter sp.]|jgi:hypothetical protein